MTYIYLAVLLCYVLPVTAAGVTFKELPEIMDVTNNRNTQLTCEILSQDAANYTLTWFIGGKQVMSNERRYQEGNVLYFSPVKKDLDDNKIQCIATDKRSEEEFESKPTLFNIKWMEAGGVELKNPSDRRRITSDVIGGIVMKCNITGNPKPSNVRWRVNGTIISNSGHRQMMRNRLNITKPRVGIDDGSYTCCATQRHRNQTLCTPPGGEFKLRVVDRREPVLIRAPSDQVVKKGSSAFLDCVYEAVPPPKITWLRVDTNKEITNKTRNNKRKRCIYPNGTLALFNVRDNQAGDYECIAIQGDIKSTPVSAKVSIGFIQKFSEERKEEFVLEGRNFEFNCEKPRAVPEATITWTKAADGTVIEGRGHVSRLEDNLVIDSVRSTDAGAYICTASNLAGSVSKNVTIIPGVPPKFNVLQPQQAKEGSNVTWVCPLRAGFPTPSVTWYKERETLNDVPGEQVTHGNELILIDVDMNDQGSYSCGAINEVVGNSEPKSNSATLTITERFKFHPALKDTCVAEGERNVVNCTVNGNDSPEIVWTRENSSAGNLPQKNYGRLQSLIISNTSQSDAGDYRCTASSASLTLHKTIHIRVVRRPHITVPPRNETVFDGKPVMLDCASPENETFQVTWQFKDNIYTEGSKNLPPDISILRNGSLYITLAQKDDSGIYICFYTNCIFKASASAELSVADELPDGPPVSEKPTTNEGSTKQLIQTIALSVSGGIAYVLISVALIIYCRGKHRKKRKGKPDQGEEEKMLNGSSCNGRAHGNHDDELVTTGDDVPMEDLSRLDPDVENFFYPASNIESVTLIGKGDFGDVFLSKAPGIFPDLEEDILVMVKEYHTPELNHQGFIPVTPRSEFLREVNLLRKATHENIVKLLGVTCKYSELKVDHLITEYLDWGILKTCLEASKDKRIPKFSKNHKMSMCCQLACALDHLAKLGLTHRDVATRNCVVSSQLLVKLSLLGLTREGFENEYYECKGKCLPIRWMAPEALFEGKYSSKSDVWSFAVTCWEIFSLGDLPFSQYSDEEFVEACHSDEPPVLPPLHGSKRITSLVKKCCFRLPSERPDIKQIMRKLQSIIGSGDAPENGSVETRAVISAEAGDFSAADTEDR